MDHQTWDTPSGRQRRWEKRHSGGEIGPRWAAYLVLALAVVLLATFAWQGYDWLMHRGRSAAPAQAADASAAGAAISSSSSADWERGVLAAFDAANRNSGAGSIAAAEMAVDRGASIVGEARLRKERVAADFFDQAISSLDRVLTSHAGDRRLEEHVTSARVELAQLRSSLNSATLMPAAAGADSGAAPRGAAGAQPIKSGSDYTRVTILSPRSVPANAIVDAALLGGKFVDATAMPGSAEIFLPPSSRIFADGVKVSGLDISGASQTLDGIHWDGVTFSGTRLRYEGGEVSLRNVHFAQCTFGFIPSERGARLATAIALGQTTIFIE
jgi:hypothetical protein